ncbi:MAG: lamin tail domain-containing protein [Verrucomicrobia bacterium]|nr:lamin tail domain-containing protein [Verrucomicrobiota bacterium]
MNKIRFAIAMMVLAFVAQAAAAPLFERGATWRWRPGSTEASSPVNAWRTNGFNDAEFVSAPAPFWYGDALAGGTQITGMSGVYGCIFLRLPFVVTNVNEIAALRMGALVDDGFIAWINGTEVLRVNSTNPPGTAVSISDFLVNAAEPVAFTSYSLPAPPTYLVDGTNMMAVQVFQSSLGSSDLGFDASLDSILVETNPPVIVSVTPEPYSTVNRLTELTVTFSEPVTGVDAYDLLLNGARASGMTPLSSTTYQFWFPQPAYGTVTITWDAAHGIADEALPPNPFDREDDLGNWYYTLVDNTPPVLASASPAAGATVRWLTNISVLFSEAVTGVDAADLLINGNAATGMVERAADTYMFSFPQPPTGQVQVAWIASHGITDQSAAANPFGGGAWEYTLDPNAATSQPYISEFMAWNVSAVMDEDGDYSDWIEIHNPTAAAVDLDNWYLTDNLDNLTKWRFPATNLVSGGYLLVWASEKNRRVPGAPLHTSFKLSAGGEDLALVRGDTGTIVSHFKLYPPQAVNVSYGVGSLTTNETVIATNAPARVRVPLNANDGLAWTQLGYDDSTWTPGTNGVGYGNPNATSADYGAVVAPTQPVGFWRFSETSGTTAANAGSGAGLNGLYSGATLGSAGPRPPAFAGFEENNTAPTFNGSSSYVSVNNSLLNGVGAFTIAGWVKCATTSFSRTGLFGQNDCVEFGFISAGTLQCWTPSGGSLNVTYTPTVGTWFHVAAVGNGSTIRIFINGVQAGSGDTATTSYGSSSSHFNIGGGGIYDAAGNFFNGQIDEVVAYHRALNDAEIASLYQGALQPAVVAVTPYVKTDIASAMSNINASAYVRLPFTIEDPTRVAALTLKMRYDDGFVAFLNGSEAARANAPATLAYDSAATADHSPGVVQDIRLGALTLQAGANLLAIQGLNRAAGNEDFLVQAELVVTYVAAASSNPLYFSPATPGMENIGGVIYPGPSILNPTHTPNTPLDDQDLVVTAQVVPTFNAVGSVVMRYRTMFNPEIEVAMADDGAHGDGAAGDGWYGATIPASAGTNGQMIRWFIRATDALGNGSRWPLFNGADSTEYLGTVVNPDYVTSKLPIIHLFAPATILQPGPGATSQTGADSQAGSRGVSLYYDGEFYDNIQVQLRGNTTAGYAKKSHRFEFNRDHLFRHAGAGFGKPDRPAPRISKTSFVADYPDPTYMRQGLTFWLCDLIGSPGSFYYPVRLQLNGKFYQLANHNDVQVADLLERIGFDPNGALYNAAGTVQPSRQSTGGFEKKTRKWDNDNDYAALAASLYETNSVGTRGTNFFEQFDVPNAINYLVAARWAHENDDVWANMSLYHDNDGDNLWRIIAFDVNLSWGAIFYEGSTTSVIEGVQATNDIHKAHPLYGSSQTLALSGPGAPNNFNRVYDTVFQYAPLREMFLRRMRTMMDTCVKPPGTPLEELPMEQKVLEWRDLIAEEAELDRNYWGWPGKGGQCNFDPGIRMTNGVTAMINEFIVKRRHHFHVKHCVTNTALPVGISKAQNAGIPLSQSDTLLIDITAVEFNPASGNQDQEYIVLVNHSAEAADLSGWTLSGGVDFTFAPGTVIPAGDTLYVSPNVRQFRARTTDPRGGQGLFVVGPYRGQLSARGETILLADRQGRPVASRTYAGEPSLAQQYLRVTEIMYNPGDTQQDFEYLKLKNVGPVALDLAGIHFTNGIYFGFTGSAVTSLAPGQTVLIVASTNAFASRYGAGFAIAGEYDGFLENGGERLRLLDAMNEEILDFEYDDGWYPLTDGLGFSLIAVDELAEPDAWGRKSQWRASGYLGSPGEASPSVPVLAPIVINEALTHTDPPTLDTIELYNPTATNVDLGGWFLTDDPNTPWKYRIAEGTVIPAGGYLCFDESQFNAASPAPGVLQPFALDADGDEVYLLSGDATTNLTGYMQGFDFGAAPSGVTFGRHVTSVGEDHFVAQSAPTLTRVNAGPLVGPIVISEIMYHPPDVFVDGDWQDNNADEYVELHNISAESAPLYDPDHSTNTWRLRDAVAFTFPTHQSLPPGGYALVVGFDPSQDAEVEAFRLRNGVPAGVPVYGPWDGELNNASDRVELVKPDVPDAADGDVPWVLVERIKYADQAPWPGAADGLGYALQRRALGEYGNDPAHWGAATPTPGTAAGTGAIPVITVHPADQTVVELQPVSFLVEVEGAGPFTYAWRCNGRLIDGATNATLLIPSARASHVGTYSVLVSSAGWVAMSSNAVLRVQTVPVITVQPEGKLVNAGSNVTFSVSAVGTGPLTYQWRRYAVDIPWGTNASITITNARFDINDGYYAVLVSDTIGSRESDPARLTVKQRPGILVPLAISPGTNLLEGRSYTMSITATGNPPMGFRFRLSSGPTPNQYFAIIVCDSNVNTAVLAVDNLKSNLHTGVYDVGITNAGGSLLSTKLSVVVSNAPPFFALQPADQTIAAGGTATLVSEARGTDPIGYQWFFNTTPIPGATNASLVLADVEAANQGAYVAVASNYLGSATSSVAQLTVEAAPAGPQIVLQPTNQIVTPCMPAVFVVDATSPSPLGYQWFFNGTNALAGATNATYAIAKPLPAHQGDYTVVVTNTGGAATSDVATLVVQLGDCDTDGMPDAWELQYGLDPTDPADADLDPDRDGRSNVQEAISGTDPNSALSVLKVSLANGGSGAAVIRFMAMPGIGYSVLHRNNPASGAWLVLTNLEPLAVTNLIQVVDPDAGAAGSRFYRLVTPMQR